MFQRRVVGLVLSIAAVVLVAAAIASHQWWTAVQSEDEVHVGLWDAEVCATEHQGRGVVRCREGSLGRLLRGELDQGPRSVWDEQLSDDDFLTLARPRASVTFIALGAFTLLAGIASIVALIVACAISARRSRTAPLIAAVFCGALALFALAFVLAAPARLDELRAGVGLPLTLVGAALGALGSLAFLRVDPALEPTDERMFEAHRFAVLRAPALAAGAVGAALILGSVFTDTWFRGRGDGVSLRVGLQDVEICRGEQCWNQTVPARVDGARHPTRMKIFVAVGTLTMWTGLAATLTFAVIALLALLRQGVRRLPLALHAASAAYGLLAIAYALSWPKEIEDVHIWLGPALALAGCVGLAGSGILLSRWLASIPTLALAPVPVPHAALDAPVPDPIAASPDIPLCPVCRTPMLWVTAKSAYLCTLCPRRNVATEDE